ncbi:hypothetical protein [Paenibacillus senegalensis]|uniref:hypothetical protein n=1 Tax=Paenibacillus senegalensis TaxID=1465766 RepID=UPI0002895B1C|nr:hypothetical protein [Paenibacillus senegalensis]
MDEALKLTTEQHEKIKSLSITTTYPNSEVHKELLRIAQLQGIEFVLSHDDALDVLINNRLLELEEDGLKSGIPSRFELLRQIEQSLRSIKY